MLAAAQILAIAGYFILMSSALLFFMGLKRLETNRAAARRWIIAGVVVAALAVTLLGMAV